MKNIASIIKLAGLALTVSLTAAEAASNDALLELLVKKGVLTEAEATEVARELEAEAPVVVMPKSKHIKDVKLTGRLHLQYDNISNDVDASSQNGFYFRRIYLGAEAKFSNDWYGAIIANFGGEDGEVDIDKAIIGWKYDPMAEIEFGYTKVPFGLYETTSSSKIKTVERSIANRFFMEGKGLAFGARHTGVFVEGDLGGGFSYATALVSSTAGNDRIDKLTDDNNGLAAFGRLQWESAETDAGQLLVGVDAGVKQDGSNHVSGGGMADGDLFAYGLHANYALGAFNLSGEFLGAQVENVGGRDADVFGFTVIPSYKLNEKWEIVAAYSIVESDGANLLNAGDVVRRSNVGGGYDEGESVYLGFNYYIIGNDLKLSGGYEKATFESADSSKEVDLDAFRLRLQMLF